MTDEELKAQEALMGDLADMGPGEDMPEPINEEDI